MEALLKCDLSQPPAPKTRTRKPSMEQGLGTVLDLQGV
ncbi:hypothetical protein ISF6_2235 [Piscinibacter sakaiensis]|uniref:Uncharacterized protein n=2 Tax=Piscinibacter sakaiensis TaxID=1547922 RepID=A0A0K8P2J6_PISS1|nr:hypothetical protein ISF6_2235 [Piscinibacter sakaiensis]